jgi:serine protease
MKKIYFIILFFLLSTFSFLKAQENNIVSGNIIAMVGSEKAATKLVNQLQSIEGTKTNFKIDRTLSESMHIYLFDFDESLIDRNKMLRQIKNNPLIKTAQFNHYFSQRATVPNDTLFTKQWDMNNTGQSGNVDTDIDAPEAWDITTGGLTAQGDTIVVAVIEDGFDLTHQDLNFWKNYQEIPGDSIDNDSNGYIDDYKGWNGQTSNDVFTVKTHGTHVCGTVGAKGNNVRGLTGVNWNVKVMPICYGNASTNAALESNAIACYSYVRDQRKLYNQTNGVKGAFIVSTNSSFGVDSGQPSAYPLWCAMYDSLGNVGILSAGATANHLWNIDTTSDIPTACNSNWLVTVTNTTNTDALQSSAGYGATTIDIGAPGTVIWSTLPGNTYGVKTGTSMATPHIAGAIALMYSVQCDKFITNYKADPAGIALMIKDSLLGAVDLITDLSTGSYPTVSGGRLNLFKSVKAMQNYCADVYVDEKVKINNEFQISAYPNPATSVLNLIYSGSENAEINICNLLGQTIKTIQTTNENKGIQHSCIDISSINKGIYFVSIKSKNKKSNVVKVVVY